MLMTVSKHHHGISVSHLGCTVKQCNPFRFVLRNTNPIHETICKVDHCITVVHLRWMEYVMKNLVDCDPKAISFNKIEMSHFIGGALVNGSLIQFKCFSLVFWNTVTVFITVSKLNHRMSVPHLNSALEPFNPFDFVL